MIDRRLFLRVTSLVAAASALGVRPVAAQSHADKVVHTQDLTLQAPGTYQITGRVRLQEPLVEISGITNAQQISWSNAGATTIPVAGFTSFEHFDQPWRVPDILVRGGRLEALTMVPVDLG